MSLQQRSGARHQAHNMHQAPGRLVLEPQPSLSIPALYVHDLTGTLDAHQLLSKPAPVHPGTSRILPNLRQWNPEVASLLAEKDINKHIPFKLITTSPCWVPGQVESFIALSYCWHGQDWKLPRRFGMSQPKWNFPIFPAMLKAIFLYHYADPKAPAHLALWVDQLCINQEDAVEKLHAVSSMDTIYRNASLVKILLEDVDISIEEEVALTFFTQEHHANDNVVCVKYHYMIKFLAADRTYEEVFLGILVKMFKSRWFSRAWCNQEYMLGPVSRFLIIGQRLGCIALEPDVVGATISAAHAGLSHLAHCSTLEFLAGKTLHVAQELGDRLLYRSFNRLHCLSCSYTEDIIAICLNTSGIGLPYIGGSKEREECKFILAVIALSAGDVSVLGAEGMPIQASKLTSRLSPLYWPSRFKNTHWSRKAMYESSKLSEATQIAEVTPTRTTLDVYITVSRPINPSSDYDERTCSLLMLLDARDGNVLKIVRCIFDCGSTWLDMVSERLYQPLLFLPVEQLYMNEVSYQSIKEVILESRPNTAPLPIPDATMRRMAQFVVDLVSPLRLFAHLEATRPLIVYLDSANTERAIALIPTHLIDNVISGLLVLAIPLALDTPEASNLRRLWILSGAEGNNSELTIVERGYFLAATNLNVEIHDNIRYAQAVTIRGQRGEELDNVERSTEDASPTEQSEPVPL